MKIGLDKSLLVKRYSYSTDKKSDLTIEIENGITVVEIKQLAYRTSTPEVNVLEPGTHQITREKVKAAMPLFKAVQTYDYSFVAFRTGEVNAEGEALIGGKKTKIGFVTSFKDPKKFYFEILGAKQSYERANLFELLLAVLKHTTPNFDELVAHSLNGPSKTEVSKNFPEFAAYMETRGLSKPKVYLSLD